MLFGRPDCIADPEENPRRLKNLIERITPGRQPMITTTRKLHP